MPVEPILLWGEVNTESLNQKHVSPSASRERYDIISVRFKSQHRFYRQGHEASTNPNEQPADRTARDRTTQSVYRRNR